MIATLSGKLQVREPGRVVIETLRPLGHPSLLFLRVSDEVAIDVMTAGHVTWTPAQWAPP
jgi:hypothetical protein